MARRRKRPSLEAWLFSLVGTFATVYLVCQAIVGHIHRVTDRQIAQGQETLRRVQQQQMERQQQARQPVYQHQAQQLVSQQAHAHPPRQQAVSDQEIERVAQQIESARQRAEQEWKKNEAWEHFYTPTQACELPESQARVDVCTAREARFRKEFEQRWAAGEFSQPRG